jgi:hypothetical protein
MRNMCEFLDWSLAKSASTIVARMKAEYLMLLSQNTDGFRETIGALRSFGVSDIVRAHTFPLPEDRCVRLLLKILGKLMPENEVRE